MTIEDKKRELALNRIQQAEESLEEAEYLFDGKKSPRSVINRTYYAMFYAILALLIFEKFGSSKHSGVQLKIICRGQGKFDQPSAITTLQIHQ